jgi:hypothetical protein
MYKVKKISPKAFTSVNIFLFQLLIFIKLDFFVSFNLGLQSLIVPAVNNLVRNFFYKYKLLSIFEIKNKMFF